jgi:gluconate 2-dehydrogenase gamma chain
MLPRFSNTGANTMHNILNTLSRRQFLQTMSMLAGMAASFPTSLLAQRRTQTAVQPDWIQELPWRTLSAVQEILFPAGKEQPGASDIGAIQYLHQTLTSQGADNDEKEFIFKGVGWLNDLTKTQTKKLFIELDEQQQEQTLEQIVKSRAGRRWLSRLLSFLLEALLADPVYGGNINGIGWQWLEHQPGYPTPPPDKTWYRLSSPVYYRRKA